LARTFAALERYIVFAKDIAKNMDVLEGVGKEMHSHARMVLYPLGIVLYMNMKGD
jgi:hypothetical protein